MVSEKPQVLIVDDRQENLFVLERLLQTLDVEVILAARGTEALALTLDHDFCVAIVDVQMPEMDGYELVELLRGNKRTARLPVIFVSAIYSDEYHHRRAYDAGAVDFLSKPFVPEILISKVEVFIDLYRQRQQLELLVRELNTVNASLSERAVQLETSATISHQITSILDKDRLLAEIADLIRTRFGYCFVGVWLYAVDEEVMILRASSANAECQEIAPGSVVSCTDEDLQPIARVCRNTAIYYNDGRSSSPENTPPGRAHLVLPLVMGSYMYGALEILHARDAIFDSGAITVLQSQADQIAIAIRNAELYAEVRALNEDLESKVRERTAELEKTYHQLELLDRNKSEFIQIVSHELRTPLTLIMGFGEMLREEPQVKQDPALKYQLEGVTNGALRMQEIVDSMLDVVKIDSRALGLQLHELQLADLFASLREELDVALQERDLALEFVDISTLPSVEADSLALRKLFANLLYNAVKYTPDGGRISVTGRFLDTLGDEASSYVEIVVSDTGIGIDPENHELIFTKFYGTADASFHSSGRTKFKGGGPGLGLAISRGIVEAHVGHIWVESPGHNEITLPGSQFHVVLPLRQTEQTPEEIARRIVQLRSALALGTPGRETASMC
ncbi:MAG: response regulator [Anaerolineae bacterium]|nr:response regulator [Anaerolineae bacterium]